MDFYTGARLKELTRKQILSRPVHAKDGKDLEVIVDRVISAVGVSPNVEGIGLEDVGINLDKNGFIAVDEYSRTSIEGIYAIGDVCGGPCLAHKASREGIICVEKIAAKTGVSPLDKSQIPGCIYCNPQVSRVGLTEMQARDRGYKIKVGRFPFACNGKAIALGHVKVWSKPSSMLKPGNSWEAHMVGHEVTEIIHGFGLARDLEATEGGADTYGLPSPDPVGNDAGIGAQMHLVEAFIFSTERIIMQPEPEKPPIRKPAWLKLKLPTGSDFETVRSLIGKSGLHTVCQEAKCPNQWECFSRQTATFLIMGSRCTRNCRFCAVEHGPPIPPDPQEPLRVAEAARSLGLRYVVVTSVTRDDLSDGGASFFAAAMKAIREKIPEALVEVLIPDFQGDSEALFTVVDARPDVLNHNIETVQRLYPPVRPGLSRSIDGTVPPGERPRVFSSGQVRPDAWSRGIARGGS